MVRTQEKVIGIWMSFDVTEVVVAVYASFSQVVLVDHHNRVCKVQDYSLAIFFFQSEQEIVPVPHTWVCEYLFV